jgi:RNA polymerase sigma-70 factor (ECF subfamily)
VRPNDDGNNERQLVDAAKAGYELALSELHALYFSRIYRYGLAVTGSAYEADNLADEVWKGVLNGFKRFRWRYTPFAVSLFRIAYHIVANASTGGGQMPVTDGPSETAQRSDEQATNWRWLNEIMFGAQALPVGARQVIALRFAAGLTVQETAQVIGRDKRLVRMLEHIGVARLREMLGFSATVPEDLRRAAAGSKPTRLSFGLFGIGILSAGLLALGWAYLVGDVFGGAGAGQPLAFEVNASAPATVSPSGHAAPKPTATQKPSRTPPAQPQIMEDVIKGINDARATQGNQPLRQFPQLTAASQWMAEDSAIRCGGTSQDSLGRTPDKRLAAFGVVVSDYKSYPIAANNLFDVLMPNFGVFKGGSSTPSPGDVDFSRPEFNAIGIGYADSPTCGLNGFSGLWFVDVVDVTGMALFNGFGAHPVEQGLPSG